MNKESQHEGWLIKSPPTKRIWRARWRRRWFTLKQGEIPEQFCLEYYTDRNCRKLKGSIDLDQCEQVDCGLRLENRKQKFQFMFDIKTPKRTYYLAADTEADMRDWVNCICQVCHLHDTKQTKDLIEEQRVQHLVGTSTLTSSTNNTTTTSLNSSLSPLPIVGSDTKGICNITTTSTNKHVDINQKPQTLEIMRNNSDSTYVNTDYTNRETVICDVQFDPQLPTVANVFDKTAPGLSTNVGTDACVSRFTPKASAIPSSSSAVYLNSDVFHETITKENLIVNGNNMVRKIPENLVLNQTALSEFQSQSVQPSPALSTASGPYIPISECFSGSPKLNCNENNPTTPLNNLDPKFYDTPRSHNNIGLNLTNDQSYSPKIPNCSSPISGAKTRSHRSDSDSESVFTDDDEWAHPLPLRENVDRSTRPSDSSIENESFIVTYSQRFSKMTDEINDKDLKSASKVHRNSLNRLTKVLKNKNNLILDFKDGSEKITRELPQFSDTENTSPAIGPRDSSSVVDESYDIPRSHNLPYYNMANMLGKISSAEVNPLAASTPTQIADVFSVLPGSPAYVTTVPRSHCYTNAAPSKVDGNVFRYDFIEQADLPPVNRKLKPKVNVEDKPPEELPAKPPTTVTNAESFDDLLDKLTKMQSTSCSRNDNTSLIPPSIDRNLKPNAFKISHSSTLASSSRRTAGAPHSMVLSTDNENYVIETHTLPRKLRQSNFSVGSTEATNQSHFNVHHQRTASAAASVSTQITPVSMQMSNKAEHKLQYCDLDVANPPAINRQSISTTNLNVPVGTRFGISGEASARLPVKSGVVYNSVDFVKTEAFQRIREERKKESENNSGSCNNATSSNISNK